MSTNLSNESPFLSSNIDNSTNIRDILEQIKKKSEEFSTSDASIKLFQNLSNPTNLTNPQIITSLNYNLNQNIAKINKFPLLKPNKLVFSNDYTKKQPKKSKTQINITTNISPFSTIDPFNLNNYHKLVKKAELKILLDKNRQKSKRIHLDKINRNIISVRESLNSRNNKPVVIIPENQSEIAEKQNIWEKIKKVNKLPKNKAKNIKIDIIRFVPKRDYIEKTNLIKLMQYNNNNKNERYYNYLSKKNSQMKSTDDLINKLQNSKDFLEKKYNEDYISYLRFLGKEIEKEKKININLMNGKNQKLYEVTKLEKYIDKIKNIKKNLIKWLYLQIQVKENLPYFPKYYEYIIEDNISLNEVNKRGKGEYNINMDEYIRIRNYKGKNVYDDAKLFFKKIEDLEIRSLTILNNKLDLIEEDNKLKKEIDELKKKYLITSKEEGDKLNEFIYKLKDAKKTNIQLKNKLISIKYTKKIKKKSNDKIIVNKLAAYSQINNNIQGMNHILKNKKSMLYYFTFCLYYIVTSYNIEELKDDKINLNIFKEDDKIILDILLYTEKLLNYLLANKKYYYSNEKLKSLYEKAKEETDKKTKMEKMLIQIKMSKNKEIEKREKLKEKLNKQYYKPSRKIELDYYRKQMNKKSQTIMDKSIKNETKFEDFFYDIYS